MTPEEELLRQENSRLQEQVCRQQELIERQSQQIALLTAQIEELHAFHLQEAKGLGVDQEIDEHFHELNELARGLAIMGELTPRATDASSRCSTAKTNCST